MPRSGTAPTSLPGMTIFGISVAPVAAAYGVTTLVLVVLDLLWLGVVAKAYYTQAIGHLMADKPYLPAALSFYALFPVGLMVFAVVPFGAPGGWRKALLLAALFGFFTYATYDLTNLATLRKWPASLALLDIAWGIFVSMVSAAAGWATLDRMAFSSPASSG